MRWTRLRPVRRVRRRSPIIDILALASQGYASRSGVHNGIRSEIGRAHV